MAPIFTFTNCNQFHSPRIDTVSSVDGDLGAIDIARPVRSKKHNRIGNFFHASPSAGKDPPLIACFLKKLLLRLSLLRAHTLGPGLSPFGCNQSRDDGVDGDAIRGKIPRKILRHMIHRGIVEAMRHCRTENTDSSDTADVDDSSTAIARKMWKAALNGTQRAHHLAVDIVHPLGIGPCDLPICSSDCTS